MALTALETKLLEDLTADDVHAFLSGDVHETQALEFKQPAAKSFKRRASVSALANTYGGTFVLGIVEADHVATGLDLIPDCVGEAHKLGQSLNEGVNPPIATMRIRPVLVEDDKGVIVVRVQPSPRRPHAVVTEKGVFQFFARRGAETKQLFDMREVQDIALSAAIGRRGVEDRIAELQAPFLLRREAVADSVNRPPFAIQICAVPSGPMRLARPEDPKLQPKPVHYTAPVGDGLVNFPFLGGEWTPMLGGQSMARSYLEARGAAAVHRDGSCELELSATVDPASHAETSDVPLFLSWYLDMATTVALWCEQIRLRAGDPDIGFDVATLLTCDHSRVSMFVSGNALGRKGVIPRGVHRPEAVTLGSPDDAVRLLNVAMNDLTTLSGGFGAPTTVPFDLDPTRKEWGLPIGLDE